MCIRDSSWSGRSPAAKRYLVHFGLKNASSEGSFKGSFTNIMFVFSLFASNNTWGGTNKPKYYVMLHFVTVCTISNLSCLVHVGGVNTTADKMRQFCVVSTQFPISKFSVILNIFETEQLQIGNCLILSAVVFTPPTRTRQNNRQFVLSVSAV